MAIEPIRTAKAPKNWRPSSDQLRQIETDSRLKRMSRDDQYFYFNKPKSQPQRGPAPATPAAPTSGVFGWIDTVINAMKGT